MCVEGPPCGTIVSASRDHSVAVWDTRQMTLRHMCRGHSDVVVSFYYVFVQRGDDRVICLSLRFASNRTMQKLCLGHGMGP